jgi:hypothetical protein
MDYKASSYLCRMANGEPYICQAAVNICPVHTRVGLDYSETRQSETRRAAAAVLISSRVFIAVESNHQFLRWIRAVLDVHIGTAAAAAAAAAVKYPYVSTPQYEIDDLTVVERSSSL